MDTGSTSSYISNNLADDIGFEPSARDSVFDGVSKEILEFGYHEDIKLENVSFQNIEVGILDETIDITCDIDGVIGMNVLELCVWSINLTKEELKITNTIKSIKDADTYYKQRLRLMDRLAYVMCGFIPSYRSTMLIDLGDNCEIALNKSWFGYSAFYDSLQSRGMAFQTSFNFEIDTAKGFEQVRFDKFNFGKTTSKKIWNRDNYIENPVADWDRDANDVNVIGAGMLDYYAFIFDFTKKKFYSKIIAQKIYADYSFGIGIMPYQGKYIVSTVWNNSSAREANINPGEQIIKINDLDLTDPNIRVCKMYAKIEYMLESNDSLVFKIKGRTGIQKHHLQKKELFDFVKIKN